VNFQLKLLSFLKGDICKKKWKYLSEAYREALKLKEGLSGDAGIKTKKPWKYEKQMEFLRCFVAHRAQTGNISTVATHDNIADEHEIPNTEISEESTPSLYGDSTCSLNAVCDDGSFSQSSVSGSSIISPVSGRTTGPLKKRQKQDEPTVASVLGQPQHPIDKFFLS
jgi:hypothetical protein